MSYLSSSISSYIDDSLNSQSSSLILKFNEFHDAIMNLKDPPQLSGILLDLVKFNNNSLEYKYFFEVYHRNILHKKQIIDYPLFNNELKTKKKRSKSRKEAIRDLYVSNHIEFHILEFILQHCTNTTWKNNQIHKNVY